MKGLTRLYSRAVTCVLVPLTAMAAATSAHAQAKVTVTAKGTIAPACAVSSTNNFTAASFRFTSSGSSSATASVTCNQFFKVTTTSVNGAIKSSTPPAGSFSNSLPYSLRADVGLDDGTTQTATCASSSLVAGQSSCTLSPASATGLTSHGQIATAKTTTLTASWDGALLVPGSYSDTITLTIAVVP